MENFRKFPHVIEKDVFKLPGKWSAMESVGVLSQDGSLLLRITDGYHRTADAIYNFKVRPDDVWVVTFPKSGTTVTQEMVWLIVNDDYETAKKEPLIKRFPFLELNSRMPEDVVEKAKEKFKDDENKLKNFNEIMSDQCVMLGNKDGRRFIKSHLTFNMLPPELFTSGCKVIYVARNPKDVAVSYYKFFFPNSPDDEFSTFYELFQNNCLQYTPYWTHVKQGWQRKGSSNYLFMFYEDLIKDMESAIKKVATFLEKDMTHEQVEKLEEHLNIDNARNNKSITRIQTYYIRGSDDKDRQIVRKGGEGGWRKYFTDDLNSKANEWIKQNYKETDLRFPVALEY